tara:strand:+ start:1622 stop:2119 length:498 start_codon:yes stop_codon:yes gene_type:complete
MNEKTDLSKIKGNLNKAEIKLLNMADPEAVSKAMEKTSFDDIAEMVSRVYAMEFDQENPKGPMSDQDKAIMLAEKLRRIRAKNKANPMGKKDGGVVKKFNEGGDAKTDGKVPNKFKGFSKLPEEVQQKIDKDLASKYKKGGEVKKKSAIKKRIAIRGFGIAKRGY